MFVLPHVLHLLSLFTWGSTLLAPDFVRSSSQFLAGEGCFLKILFAFTC